MNTAEAKRILSANKDIKELWLTDDGQMFFTENAAQNHARSLENKELEKVSVGVKEPEGSEDLKEPGEPKEPEGLEDLKEPGEPKEPEGSEDLKEPGEPEGKQLKTPVKRVKNATNGN